MKLNRILNLIFATTIALVPCIAPEKPSPEVINQIGKLILQRIGLKEPPPKVAAKKSISMEAAKTFRRNAGTQSDEKLVEKVTLFAQVSSGGQFFWIPFAYT